MIIISAAEYDKKAKSVQSLEKVFMYKGWLKTKVWLQFSLRVLQMRNSLIVAIHTIGGICRGKFFYYYLGGGGYR